MQQSKVGEGFEIAGRYEEEPIGRADWQVLFGDPEGDGEQRESLPSHGRRTAAVN